MLDTQLQNITAAVNSIRSDCDACREKHIRAIERAESVLKESHAEKLDKLATQRVDACNKCKADRLEECTKCKSEKIKFCEDLIWKKQELKKTLPETTGLFPVATIPSPSTNGTINEIDVFKKLLPLFQYGLGKGIWKSVEEFIKIDNNEINKVKGLMENEGKE